MAKKKKFNWASQTEIGKRYGLSGIAVGKILISCGLKAGNKATEKAISEGYATFTPLKDGTHHYMWNISKVKPLLEKEHPPLSKVDLWANKVKSIIKHADKLLDEGDKVGYWMMDCAFEDVPAELVVQVKEKVNHEYFK